MNSFLDDLEPIKLKIHGIRLPEIKLTKEDLKLADAVEGISNAEFLKKLSEAQLEKYFREGVLPKGEEQKYRDRLEKELEILEELHFTDYILLVWDTINFCRKKDIPVGDGRGSAAGSLVLYLTQVTGKDPVKYNLIFERFISRARARSQIVDGIFYIDGDFAPDVDLDICHDRREEVIEYLKNKYEGRVCKLSTHQTLSTKILFKECGKIIGGYSEDHMRVVAGYIPTIYGKVFSIEKAMEAEPRFKKFCEKNPDILNTAYKLRKIIRNKSSHASAYLVSYEPLDKNIPCERSATNEFVSAYDMNTAQSLAIKLDLLGLKGITLIDKVLKSVKIDPRTINVDDDRSIYDHFKDLRCGYGLFQISGDCNLGVARSVQPKNIEELSDVVALARPGALAYVDKYVGEVELNKEELLYDELRDVLSDTRYIPIYQEQMMAIAHKVFGFTLEESDVLRKIVGKKKVEQVKEWKEKIFAKAKERNIKQEVADFFWKILDESSNYSFNKSLGKGCQVSMEHGGKKNIEEVEVGDRVIAFCVKTKKPHIVEVKDTFSHIADLYRVKFQNGIQIDCSMEHKFLCEDMRMRPLKEIISNDFSIITKENTSKILATTPLGRQISYDLEVDHSDHNFYANGTVTSNSHSLCYASLAALTVYLKFNHPKEFFLECLKMALGRPDPREEIAIIHQEMKEFGLALFPPDIVESDIEFKLEENGIRFGLSAIKGISDKTVSSLRDFIKKDRTNKLAVFDAAKSAGLTVGHLCALIQAGSLDSLDRNRTKMVMEGQLWSLMTPRERIYALQNGHKYNFDLIEMIKDIYNWKNDKGRQLVRDGRLDTLRRNFDRYKEIYFKNKKHPKFANYVYERKLLGFSYSEQLKDVFSDSYKNLTSIAEIKMEEDNYNVECVAEVKEVKKSTAKKSGKKYLRMLCTDESGEYNFMFFAEKMHQYLDKNPIPEEGNYIYLRGRKGTDIVWLEEASVQDEKIYLKLAELKQKL